MLSVIIPACNEAGLIQRCLESITRGAHPDELDIIVVCNGCRDDTAALARRHGYPLHVIETEVPSKTAALNLGDAAARGFPRFYLDADVRVSIEALRATAALLARPGVLAAAPRLAVDVQGRPWPVRAYYRIWTQLPYCRDGMIGSGLYALSQQGRARFAHFAEDVFSADDEFVRRHFTRDERGTAERSAFTISAPSKVLGLVRMETRAEYGNRDLALRHPELRPQRRDHKPALVRLSLRPHLWPALSTYLALRVVTKARAACQWLRRTPEPKYWERDERYRETARRNGTATVRRARVAIDGHSLGARQTGNETYTRNLTEQLMARDEPGLEFVVYHTLPRPAGMGERGMRRLRPHWPLWRVPLAFPYACARDHIDLAHFQYVAPPVSPCKTVLTVHDVSFERFPHLFSPFQLKKLRWLVPLSLRRAAHVITVSEHSKREIVERYGIDADRVSVVYEAAAPAFRPLDDAAAVTAVRARYGMVRPFLLSVASLEPRKNLARLVRVFAELRCAGQIEHDLLLVGQDSFRAREVVRTIERSPAARWIRRAGYVPEKDLVALYNAADFLVYPSLYEGFGLPLLEAFACGTPVLAARSTSLPEIGGDAALYADPRDDRELAAAMLRLATDARLRVSLRRKGRARARDFSWAETARATVRVYRSCL